MAKKVALVLASGGSRGMAHIGAIEELESRGYEITSIAGCSIGSLIGGIYACGKLQEAKEWFCQIDKKQIFNLADVQLGLGHLVKGDKVLQTIQEFVPDRKIEDLPIPATFVATDFVNSKEVLFRSGSLFEAIRASISIPMFFRPVRYEGTLLVDGGLVNPFPLNRVQRQDGDMLVGVNISARDRMDVDVDIDAPDLPKSITEHFPKMAERWEHLTRSIEESALAPQFNYLTLMNRIVDVQIQTMGDWMTGMCQPDVLVEMPQGAYTTFDFDKAEEIMADGRRRMKEALDKFELFND